MNPCSSKDIYNIIKGDMMALRLAPGHRISENLLAERFGVSRTPAHDALAQLTAEGIVNRYPQRGTFVSRLDWSYITQIAYLRRHLDVPVYEEAAEKMDDQTRNVLKLNLQKQKQISEEDDSDTREDFMEICEEFHVHIYQIAGRKVLWDNILRIQYDYDRYQHLLYSGKDNRIGVYKEHSRIFEYMKAHDYKRLEKEIIKHLQTEGPAYTKLLDDYNDYFRF